MNDRFTPSINDLSGALTLPLISRLFAEYQSIEKMDVLLQMLTVLFRYCHTVQAFDIICALFRQLCFCGNAEQPLQSGCEGNYQRSDPLFQSPGFFLHVLTGEELFGI